MISKTQVVRKQRALLALAVPLALSQAACSLSSRSTNRLVISMPEGGFKASAVSIGDLGVPSAGYSAPGTSGGSDFPFPTALSDFKCIGVMVSGPGIVQDPLFDSSCKASSKAGVAPNGLGQIVGLVSASGGKIDIQVQAGPNRLIQLVGVQASGDCPDLATVMNESGSQSGTRLGQPFEIARVQQDIFADQTIEMKAAFDPATASQLFSCHEGEGGSGGGDNAPLAITSVLDMYPHYPSSGDKVRVSGTASGKIGMVQLFATADCTGPQLSTQWQKWENRFVATATTSSNSSPISVRLSNGSEAVCAQTPNSYVYVPTNTPKVQITSLLAGDQLDASDVASGLGVSGSCGPYSGGNVHLYFNGVHVQDCGPCSATYTFACSNQPLSGIADGILEVSVRMEQTAPTATVDDGFFMVLDSLAPGVTLSTPLQGMIITSANVTSFPMSGTCGYSGGTVRISYYDGSTTHVLQDTVCSAGAWAATLNLSAASVPDGALVLGVYHWSTADGSHSSYAGVSVSKQATMIDFYSYYPNRQSVANAIAKDASNNLYVVGYGEDTSNIIHWIVRKWNGASWTVVDDYRYPATSTSPARATSVAVDGAGTIWVAGYADDSGFVTHWIVRKSVDNGVTWTTADDFSYYTAQPSKANALAIDSSNNVYVAGAGKPSSGTYWRWVVRKWDGSSWSTSDDFVWTANYDSEATALTIGGPAGHVYVAGYGKNSPTASQWIVREYDLSFWGGVSNYDPSGMSSYTQTPNAIAVNSAGSVIYVAGKSEVSGFARWHVASYNGGWIVLDNFAPASSMGTQMSEAKSMLIDGPYLYVGGYVQYPGLSPETASNWYVRRWDGGQWTSSVIAPVSTNGMHGANALVAAGGAIYSCGAIMNQVSYQPDWVVKQEINFQ